MHKYILILEVEEKYQDWFDKDPVDYLKATDQLKFIDVETMDTLFFSVLAQLYVRPDEN